MTRPKAKVRKGLPPVLLLSLMMVIFVPAPAHLAFLLMDAPATVLQEHEFDLNLYIFDSYNVYGIACDVIYDEPLVDIVDQDPLVLGLQPSVTEGDFLNENGLVPTLMRCAMQDALINGILVLGLTRSGQVPGVSTASSPALIMSVRYKAVNTGTAHLDFDYPGLLDAEGAPILIAASTGVDVEILPFTNTAPLIPSDPNPPDSAVGVISGIPLGWNAGDSDPEDVVTYKVYLDETSPPSALATTVVYDWNQTACTAAVTVVPGTTYYWQVVATDKFGPQTVTGPIWSFSVAEATPTFTPVPPTETPTPLPPTATPTIAPTLPPTSTPACIHNGDVNSDEMLTAADAQIAFNIALGIIVPNYEQQCAADCNNDGTVTAADGQAIFFAVLGMGTCAEPLGGDAANPTKPEPKPEVNSLLLRTEPSDAMLRLRSVAETDAGLSGVKGETISLEILLTTSDTPIDAITLDLGFCPDMLRYLECEETSSALWTEFGCNEMSEGIVRLAAFSLSPVIEPHSEAVLARLTFAVTCDECAQMDRCLLSFIGIYDDLAKVATSSLRFQYLE